MEIVVMENFGGGFQAFMPTNSAISGTGRTKRQAIGDLFLKHNKIFGIQFLDWSCKYSESGSDANSNASKEIIT